MSRLRILGLLLVCMASTQAMDIKKFSLATKMGHAYTKHTKISSKQVKNFHATKQSIETQPSEAFSKKITAADKNVFKNLTLFAASKKHQKIHYFDGKDIQILQNGVGGASAGFHIGFWGTYIVGQGAIFIACRAVDLVAPGVGMAMEPGMHTAATIYLAPVAKVVGIAGGIIGGTATGPV